MTTEREIQLKSLISTVRNKEEARFVTSELERLYNKPVNHIVQITILDKNDDVARWEQCFFKWSRHCIPFENETSSWLVNAPRDADTMIAFLRGFDTRCKSFGYDVRSKFSSREYTLLVTESNDNTIKVSCKSKYEPDDDELRIVFKRQSA